MSSQATPRTWLPLAGCTLGVFLGLVALGEREGTSSYADVVRGLAGWGFAASAVLALSCWQFRPQTRA